MTGMMSAAKRSEFSRTTAIAAALPLPARRSGAAPFGLPRPVTVRPVLEVHVPRALAAASAALVRVLIAWRSCCATTASRPIHCGNNQLTAIRAPGGLRSCLDHKGQIGGIRRPQAKRPGKEERMVGHGLRPAGILAEGGGRDIQLCR